MTANDNILTLSCLDDVDDIGHADDSGVFIKHGIILDLKVLSLSQSFIYGISFEHKGHLDSHLEAYYIVVLNLFMKSYIILCAKRMEHLFVRRFDCHDIVSFLCLT